VPVGHEQPTAHLLVGLRVEVPQALQLRAQVIGQTVDAVVVDLDEIAGRVAKIQLDNVPGQLHQMVPEGVTVKGAAPLRGSVDRFASH